MLPAKYYHKTAAMHEKSKALMRVSGDAKWNVNFAGDDGVVGHGAVK